MPQTIMIVDDFPDYVSLLEKKLASEGFATLAAYDGETAIRMAAAERPDLILMDIMMPKIGGTEVRVELLKDEATRRIPIVYLTGLRAPHAAKKVFAGGVKVVSKSNDFNELLVTIREVLSEKAR
jgi:CheY-like chemotaxis protein